MTPQELKGIEIRFGYGTTFDMSLREKDGHNLITRIHELEAQNKKLREEIQGAVEYLESAYGTSFSDENGPDPEQAMLISFRQALTEGDMK